MDAKEARRLTEANRAAKAEKQSEESKEIDKRRRETYKQGRFDGRKYLQPILSAIRTTARTKDVAEHREFFIRRDEDYGPYWVKGFREVVVPALEKKHFKVSVKTERRGDTIYEGYMNPEASGWKYDYDELILIISW